MIIEPQFLSVEQHPMRPLIPRAPVLASTAAPWRGLHLEQFSGGPIQVVNEAPLQHHIIVQLDRPTYFEWTAHGRVEIVQMPSGSVGFHPAMVPVTARNRDTREFLRLALDPKFLLCAAHDAISAGRLELVSKVAVDDPLIRGIALALRKEVETDYPGGRWYGETLASALAVHLVRHYSAHLPAMRVEKGGLAEDQLRIAIEHIHEHLAEDLSLEHLAAAAGLSPFHFARLFKRSTGLAPHQYVIQRRIERAKDLLLTSSESIAQIAARVGFCDQSHLAVHFRRAYGMRPKAFLRQFGVRRKGSLRPAVYPKAQAKQLTA